MKKSNYAFSLNLKLVLYQKNLVSTKIVLNLDPMVRICPTTVSADLQSVPTNTNTIKQTH
jgi:hypothetical protein